VSHCKINQRNLFCCADKTRSYNCSRKIQGRQKTDLWETRRVLKSVYVGHAANIFFQWLRQMKNICTAFFIAPEIVFEMSTLRVFTFWLNWLMYVHTLDIHIFLKLCNYLTIKQQKILYTSLFRNESSPNNEWGWSFLELNIIVFERFGKCFLLQLVNYVVN
jgi:hypothetical protein